MLDNGKARASSAKRIDPIAKGLLKIGVTADQVTIIGAVLSVAACVFFVSQGNFLAGGIALSLVGLSDLLDGTMARLTNTAGPWGAFLDSTLDRVVDGAIYGSLIYWYANQINLDQKLLVALLVALIAAFATSYTRARWESLGVSGKVGLIERSERTIATFAGLIITGLGLNIMPAIIYFLALTSSITVIQRMIFVRTQLKK